jgi:hypothetical protein
MIFVDVRGSDVILHAKHFCDRNLWRKVFHQLSGLPDFFLAQHTKTGKNVSKRGKYSKWP